MLQLPPAESILLPPLVEGPVIPAPAPPAPPEAAPAGPQARKVTFATKDVNPPTEFWVTPDDFLAVGVTNALVGVTLQIQCRMWTPDGDLSVPALTIIPPADRVLRYTTLPLYYGFLYSVAAFATGSPLPVLGQTYVSLQIVRTPAQTFTALLPLGANYVVPNGTLQWPYSQSAPPTSGPGTVTLVTGTTPAAGSDWSQTVPAGARWKIRFISARFVVDSTIITRNVYLAVKTGGGTILAELGGFGEGASGNVLWTWLPGPSIGGTGKPVTVQIGQGFTMEPGWTFGTITENIQPADQWSAINLTMEEVPAS